MLCAPNVARYVSVIPRPDHETGMTDIFEIRTPTQRRIVVGALLVYAALFVTNLTTDVALASPASDLVVAALVLAACVVGARRIRQANDATPITTATVAALALAGVSIGYEGLAKLDLVAPIPALEAAGSLALLAVIGLYFYEQYA